MLNLGLGQIFLNTLVTFQQQQNGDQFNKFISGAFMVTILILFLGLYYKIVLEKTKNYQKLPKLAFLVFIFIRWVKKTTLEILGRRYSFAIPFFIYIVFYFWGSSLVGMFGFQGMSTFAIVPMSIAGVVFIGTIISGIVAKGFGFFCKDYYLWLKIRNKKIFPIPDFPKILGELGKVLSLGLRLWGNFFAGAIVLYIVKEFLHSSISTIMPTAAPWTAGIALVPLHLYFDVVDGALHSMIFLILTLSYWKMAKQVEHKEHKHNF